MSEITPEAVAAGWPAGAEFTPIGYQGPARHTWTAACDGFHESQACPRPADAEVLPVRTIIVKTADGDITVTGTRWGFSTVHQRLAVAGADGLPVAEFMEHAWTSVRYADDPGAPPPGDLVPRLTAEVQRLQGLVRDALREAGMDAAYISAWLRDNGVPGLDDEDDAIAREEAGEDWNAPGRVRDDHEHGEEGDDASDAGPF